MIRGSTRFASRYLWRALRISPAGIRLARRREGDFQDDRRVRRTLRGSPCLNGGTSSSCIQEGRGRGRVVATRDYVLALDEFEHASSLGPDLKRLRGRSVVLSVRDMAKAAAALIELDGYARRIVLCPPGWEPWRLEFGGARRGSRRLGL